jgi:predicted nuclease with TOPRIM domain
MSDSLEASMMKRIGELKADLRNCITAIRVKDEENARLKAEVERLTIALDNLDKKETRLCCIAARLKGKVKELTTAGDDLVTLVDAMDVVMDMDSNHPEIKAWNKAKEERES